jgi:hypothetical protein
MDNCTGTYIPGGIVPTPKEPQYVVDLEGRVCDPQARVEIAALTKRIEELEERLKEKGERLAERLNRLEIVTSDNFDDADHKHDLLDGRVAKLEGVPSCDPSEP